MNCQSSGKPRSLAEVQPRETFPVVALKNAAVTLPTFVLAMYRRDWSGLRKMLVELPAAPTSYSVGLARFPEEMSETSTVLVVERSPKIAKWPSCVMSTPAGKRLVLYPVAF